MTSDAGFDPAKVAAALRVLETELRDELGGEDAARALRALRRELGRVVSLARAWAARYELPVDGIPDPPSPGADAAECIACLRRLAVELRRLGARRR